MNKHILLVMKWLNDKDSVSQEELVENRKSADAAYAAYALAAAAACAARAAYAAYADADAEKWVNKYFNGSTESKQDYIDALESERPAIKSEVWDGKGLPPAGRGCEATWLELPDGGGNDFCRVLIKGYFGPKVWFTEFDGNKFDIVMAISDCEFRKPKAQEEIDREEFIDVAKEAIDVNEFAVSEMTTVRKVIEQLADADFKAPKGDK